jgi:hypothetical protein
VRRLSIAVVLAGCSWFEPAPPTTTTVPTPLPPQAPIVAARRVSTAAAFDLVSGSAGTYLAWAAPADLGGGVRVLELSPTGAPRGTEHEIATGGLAAPSTGGSSPNAVLELAAATANGQLAVAWSVLVASEPTTEAAYAATPPAFAPPTSLGAMERVEHGRGNIVVASLDTGGLYVSHRITRGTCHDTSAGTDCARFARTRLPAGDDVRTDGASEVALACSPFLPGAIANDGAWFYGVCHGAESPTTTVFVIHPDPARQYAAATEVLGGCFPISLARAESGVIVRARCADDEAMARIDSLGHATDELRHAAMSVRCDGGRPTLNARDHDTMVSHRLTESESRIEAWLGSDVAPEGSRAVWSGEALLVATAIGPSSAREVQVRRFECQSDGLVRTSLPPY